jgi:hypothetical protein
VTYNLLISSKRTRRSAHDDDDMGCSCVTVVRRGSSAIEISHRRNRQPITFCQGGSARIRQGSSHQGPSSDASAAARALPPECICRTAAPCMFIPSTATRHVDVNVLVIVTAPPSILPLPKIKKHIIYLFFCNRPVVAKAKQWHDNPWNINMIFMDVLCYDVGKMDQVDKGA